MGGGLYQWVMGLLLVGIASLGMGCATVMNGTTQDIGITSVPRGAAVTVDAQLKGQTPLITALSRRSSHTVKIELAGYHPVEGTLTRQANGWIWGNIFIGGLGGASVDLLSGGMYDLHPGRIDAMLQPLLSPSEPASAESPQVAALPPVEPVATTQLVYASATLQPVPMVARTTAPQCDEPTVRELCPLYQYRIGIYRATCKDGSGVEVRPGSVKILPPQLGNPPHPWQAEYCTVSTLVDAQTHP